jgi:hypothetical protein
MSNTTKFSVTITPSDPAVPLGMEVWLDGDKIFDQAHVSQTEKFSHDMSDQDGEHELQFVLKNKLRKHTQLDANKNIIKDASIRIDDIMFEEIDIKKIVTDQAEYQHNFNGHGVDTIEKFYGEMGCNGTVTLKFSTPIYLWLLEKM